MTQATIFIGKVITKVTSNSSQSYKMGEYNSLISELNSFTLKGLSKPSKLSKYTKVAESCGFSLSNLHAVNAGFDGLNSDVIDFCIDFIKE